MAWRNITLDLNWGEDAQCKVSNFDLLSLTSWPNDWTQYLENIPDSTADDFSSSTMFGESPNYVEGIKGSSNSLTVHCYMTGRTGSWSYGNEIINDPEKWGFIACVDDDNQKGFFCMVVKNSNSTVNKWAGVIPPYNDTVSQNRNVRSDMYVLLTGSEKLCYGGGAGSGYIGNPLIDNKKMVGYDVMESVEESTKTQSVTVYAEEARTGIPKMGNGAVIITLVKEPELIDFFDMALSTDMDNAVNCNTDPTSAQWESTDILFWGQSGKQKPTISNNIIHYEAAIDYTASSVSFPLKQNYNILGCYMKVNLIVKSQDSYHDQWILAESYVRGSSDGKYRRVQYAYDNTRYPDADVFVDETGIYEFNKMFDTVYHQNRLEIGFGYGTWEILEMKLWVLESD